MLKVSKDVSTALSLVIAIVFFLCCVAGAFVMPGLVQMLIDTPDNIGNRQEITQLGRMLVLMASYGIVVDFMAADIMIFILLLRIRKRLVFTDATVALIRGISWCCLLLCGILCFLGIYFQLSFIAALCVLFLGLCLRVCKNAFEEANQIKQEHELTI